MEAGKIRAFTDLEFAKLEKNWQTATGGDASYVLCYTVSTVYHLGVNAPKIRKST